MWGVIHPVLWLEPCARAPQRYSTCPFSEPGCLHAFLSVYHGRQSGERNAQRPLKEDTAQRNGEFHGASGFWWEMTTLSLTRAQSELRWVMGVSGSVYTRVCSPSVYPLQGSAPPQEPGTWNLGGTCTLVNTPHIPTFIVPTRSPSCEISKSQKIRPRLGKRTDETSLACASDYVLESN